MRKLVTSFALATAIALSGWALAGRTADAAGVEVSFSLKEKQLITRFFAGSGDAEQASRGKGKGKKNKGVGNRGLPPGIAKKGGRLPPGIAKRQLPQALAAELPPPPKGYERVIVDKDVLLVDIATHVVHDVLTDVLK